MTDESSVAIVASEVRIVRTTSTRFITGTGLKSWILDKITCIRLRL